jgi:hypothetical protein
LKLNLSLYGSLLLTALAAHASPVLVVGTPANAYNSPPTGVSPALANIINFDNLTTPLSCYESLVGCPTFNPSTYAAEGVTISSPDGLLVYPFSTQSAPNELFDDSSDGTADITISLANGVNAIGVGIADSDPVTIYLQALGAGGVDLGSPFAETISETSNNPGNGYFLLEDTSPDIYGLVLTQPVGSANYSGLAIDDLQTSPVPEPSSYLLLVTGLALFGYFRLRQKRA